MYFSFNSLDLVAYELIESVLSFKKCEKMDKYTLLILISSKLY